MTNAKEFGSAAMDGKVRVNECEFAVVKSTLHKYENLGKNLAEPSANILHVFFLPFQVGKNRDSGSSWAIRCQAAQ